MTATELKDRIKSLARQVYQAKSVDIDSDKEVSIETEKFPILLQFSSLKDVLVDLLTKQYEIFVTDIQWVAPKPTTFRIVLANGENFMLVYNQRSWVAIVEGKRYYLLNLNEEESAVQSIARVLSYGSKPIDDPADPSDTSVDTGGGDFPGGEGGGGGDSEGGDTEIEVPAEEPETEA